MTLLSGRTGASTAARPLSSSSLAAGCATALGMQPNARALVRIDAALAGLSAGGGDPVRLACRQAERAGLLARLGYPEDAQAQLAVVRAAFSKQPNVRVTAALCVAESLLAHFTNLSAVARDKMQRAHALSTAASLPDLQAISAAWLATFHYGEQDTARMASHVAQALRLAAPEDHATRTRACMMVGIALHFAERLDLATPWYAQSRLHAMADADDASLSALTHNIAWHRGCHAVQAAWFGAGADAASPGIERYALAGADATVHFDEHTGNISLAALVPMLRAMLYSLQGLHGAALALYESYAAAAERQGLSRLRASVRSDMAWCRLRSGDHDGARREAAAAETGFDVTTDHDDRAIAHARLASIYEALGDRPQQLVHEPRAREEWQRHRAQQAETLSLLQPVMTLPGAPH